MIVAEGDFVIVHGRFSGTGRPRNWIAADVVRVADGVLAEHWDVLQDEATDAELQAWSADVRYSVQRVNAADDMLQQPALVRAHERVERRFKDSSVAAQDR